MYLKKSVYRWTHVVQTCVVQGSIMNNCEMRDLLLKGVNLHHPET